MARAWSSTTTKLADLLLSVDCDTKGERGRSKITSRSMRLGSKLAEWKKSRSGIAPLWLSKETNEFIVRGGDGKKLMGAALAMLPLVLLLLVGLVSVVRVFMGEFWST